MTASVINPPPKKEEASFDDWMFRLWAMVKNGVSSAAVTNPLGLGVTPQAWNGVATDGFLQVGERGAVAGISSGTQFSNNAWFDGSTWRYIASDVGGVFTMASGAYFWRTIVTGTAGNAATRVDTAGLDVNGNFVAYGSIGYPTGQGGTVTQATSKSQGATLSKICGAITMNNAALASDTTVSFVLTNTKIAATDVLILNHISGGTPGSYTLNARAAAGSATIDVRNVTTGSLSEAIVIQFAVFKAVSA